MTGRGRAGEVWIVMAGVLIIGAWYAHNQFLYSLYFFYQVATYIWPGVFPPVR